MKKTFAFLGFSLAISTFSVSSMATNYNFNEIYSGGGSISLAPGSDDPLATNLQAGDTFQWTITTTPGSYWNVFSGGDLFPFMSFYVSESGTRTGDYNLDLSFGGSSVFSDVQAGISNSYIHIGTNTVSVPTGLNYNEMSLSYTLISSDSVDNHITSLLPWPGMAPEAYFSGNIALVPEPEVYAMLLAGLGLLGFAARRRNNKTIA